MNAEPPADVSPAPPTNAVFLELLGSGLFYSVNYERILGALPIGLRVGASYFTWKISDASGAGNLTLATFPALASYYLGGVHHKLQLGLGATVVYLVASTDSAGIQYGSESALGIAASGVLGYRYVPASHGFTFGAGFTPMFRLGKGFLPWGGASVGYAF
jgi:hypothetical protein